MYIHRTKTRIRYSETDQMGYVYYGNYASFYEIGRVELLRSLGSSYKAMEESGVLMPVYEMRSRYFKPGRYDDEISIETTIPELSGARIHFKHRIFLEEELINEGEVTLVFIDKLTNKIRKMPNLLLDVLQPYFK